MKVWFDIDGVLSEFNPNAIRVARALWPNYGIPENYVPKDYDYSDLFRKQEWDAVWAEIKTIPDFWLRQTAFEANVSALRTWMDQTCHHIYFITSRRSTGGVGSRPQTILWLYQQGLYPKDDQPTVITVDGAKHKKGIIAEHKLDFGIDDLPATVAEANQIEGHWCYLLDQPWNQDANLPRAGSLQQFLDVVDKAASSSPK